MTTEPTAEPWGIIVTPTLHLGTWRNGKPGPRCRNPQVVRIADGIRVLWAKGERTRPIFGAAGDRPVCRGCIADARREAARLTDDADQAERWNRGPMTTEPTEGWLATQRDNWSPHQVCSPLIPAVSVAKCDRRVTDAVKAERDRCTELRALLDAIRDEATEAHFLPVLNGAIPETADGLRDEAQRLADALHRIGHSIHPERWTAPAAGIESGEPA